MFKKDRVMCENWFSPCKCVHPSWYRRLHTFTSDGRTFIIAKILPFEFWRTRRTNHWNFTINRFSDTINKDLSHFFLDIPLGSDTGNSSGGASWTYRILQMRSVRRRTFISHRYESGPHDSGRSDVLFWRISEIILINESPFQSCLTVIPWWISNRPRWRLGRR